jgi:hypothetical protein
MLLLAVDSDSRVHARRKGKHVTHLESTLRINSTMPPEYLQRQLSELAHRRLEARNTKFTTNRITAASNNKVKASFGVRKSIAFRSPSVMICVENTLTKLITGIVFEK